MITRDLSADDIIGVDVCDETGFVSFSSMRDMMS